MAGHRVTDPTTAPVPIVTEPMVRAMVEEWLGRPDLGYVLALRAKPDWPDDHAIEVAGNEIPVAVCVSALAVRAAIADRDSDERLVILTDRDEHDLGTGILAHLAKQRVVGVDLWHAVRVRFHVTSLDPQLTRQGEWAARALLEFAPAGGWSPPPGGMLTRDFAMRALAGRLLDTSADELDTAGMLQWTTRAADVARFTELPADIRDGVSAWLADTAGPVARWALAAVNAGHGTDAVALGLVAGLLRQDERQTGGASQLATAAGVRMERFLGGAQPSAEDARAWSEAAHAWVERLLRTDRAAVDRMLFRTEEILDTLQARELLPRSTVLPGALRWQLREFATAVQAALPAPGEQELAAAEHSLERLHDHTLAPGNARVQVATMAMRLLRWLAAPEPPALSTVAEAVARHTHEDGWADRARLDVWTGDSDPLVAEAYRELFRAADTRRACHDQQFAELLAASTGADEPPGEMLHVENVLPQIVRPLVDAGQPVLLVVADGMGVAASTELVDDITRSGWVELSRDGGSRVGALSALPTVTEVCRASLLAGRLRRGGQQQEHEGLTEQFGPSARLFHKNDLMAGAGAALPSTVTNPIQDPDVPVVAVVLNTIDDALDRSDPAGSAWNLDTMWLLHALLNVSHGRAVVLTSDHGHVVDRGPDAEPRTGTAATAARWRPATPPPGEGEVLVQGRRVVLDTGKAVLPWKETVRYTSRKAGYHGGASPAEAVIPLTLFTSGASAPVLGWAPAPPQAPSWWVGPVQPAATQSPAPAAEPVESPPSREATLFDTVKRPATPSTEPAAERAGGLVEALLTSDVYRLQRRRAGRAALSDERVRTLIDALLAAGARATRESLAHTAGIPTHRIRTTLATLQRLLNVEGYPVLSVDPDGVTVTLDERLLREQFDLGGKTP